MSKRQRPPDDVVVYARALTCSDCGGHGEAGEQDAQGHWHIVMRHQPSCPRLRTGEPDRDAMARAADALARVAGAPDELQVFDPRGEAMSAPDDQDDQVLVSSLSPAERQYLRFSEQRQDKISRRKLDARVSAVQGETLKRMRESGDQVHVRQRTGDERQLMTTAVAESLAVTPDGLERVTQP